MKPNSLEQMLRQPAPPPDPAVRLAARRAALQEFARVNPADGAANAPRPSFIKGLLDRVRLSRESHSHGRAVMAWNSRRLLGAAASVCIALFGSALVWNLNRQQPELTQLPRVAQ